MKLRAGIPSGTASPSKPPFQIDKASPYDSIAAASARRLSLLEGPILSTIFRLAAPSIIGSLGQMAASAIQMYFIGLLGVDALAGITIVFPCLTLMQLLGVGIGGGVASAAARSIGAGRRADADAVVLVSVCLAIVFGFVFISAEFFIGPTLYRMLGVSGASLSASLAYADLVFGASILVWLVSLLTNALNGSGNTLVPQMISLIALILTVPLAPVLMFGWGPMPRLGIAGAGLAFVCYYILATTALIGYLCSGRGTLRLPLDPRLIEWRLVRDILRVGGVSAANAVIPILSVILVLAAVGRFGVDAVAGYGIALQMDYLLLPLYFGVCAGVIPMVGTNVGAGQIRRARQIAWIGAFVGAAIGCATGLFLAFAPWLWLGLFSDTPAVIANGSLYFRTVGLQYPLTAIGIILTAAAQGAGRPFWPFVAMLVRLIIAAGGGWFAVVGLGGDLEALFMTLAIAGVVYCVIIAVAQITRRTMPDQAGSLLNAV
jgi:putative MATE family efflux protein